MLSARPESPRGFPIAAGIFLAVVSISGSAAGQNASPAQNSQQAQDPLPNQASKPEYGKQSPGRFVIRVYHGLTLRALSYQVASGNRLAEAPQPWVMRQGSQVCVEVVNAHPLKYTYVVGQIVDTTPPPDLKLPELAGTIAGAFGGSAAKVMNFRTAAPSRAPAIPSLSIDWLQTYTVKVKGLSNQLDAVKDIAKNSDNPEDVAHAEELVSQRGLRWAKQELSTVSTAKGDLGSPILEQTLSGWESDARRDAAAARDAAKLEGESKRNWDELTDEVISALAGVAAATRADWITLRDGYAKASPISTNCVTLGSHPIQVTLSVKATGTGSVRATGSSLLSINVDPYYEWKRIEAAPLAFAVYSPGAETLTLVDGRVDRKDASLRVRAGTVLLTNLSAFGARDEQSISLMLGVGLLDASSATAGKADILVGFAYRLQDVLGVGIAFSLSERNRRKDQVQIGQPLPAGITAIEAASEDSWRPGIALGVSLKGYKF